MGLDIGVLRAEKLFGPINGELFRCVDIFTTAIPALVGIAFGVFVGEDGALGFHHGRASEIFAGDQFDVLLLAMFLQVDSLVNRGVDDFEAKMRGGGMIKFINASQMPATLEFTVEKGIDDFYGGIGLDDSLAKTKDIGFIMLAAQASHIFVENERGANAWNFVC